MVSFTPVCVYKWSNLSWQFKQCVRNSKLIVFSYQREALVGLIEKKEDVFVNLPTGFGKFPETLDTLLLLFHLVTGLIVVFCLLLLQNLFCIYLALIAQPFGA